MPKMTYRIGQCGGVFKTLSGLLTSPSYPDNYPNEADCAYMITQLNGTYVNITLLVLDLPDIAYEFYDGGERTICHDYLEIRDGNSDESPLMGKLCGSNSLMLSMQSTQNNIWIR